MAASKNYLISGAQVTYCVGPTLLGILIQVVIDVASDDIEVSVHQDVVSNGQKRENCWHYDG